MADEVRINIRADGLKETVSGIMTIEEATKRRNELKVDITAAKNNITELRKQIELAMSYNNFKLSGELKKELAGAEEEVRKLSREYQTVNLAIIKAQAEEAKLAEETKKTAVASQDDWKARAEATKEAIRNAIETSKQRKEAEEAARVEKYRALEAETAARAQAKVTEESQKSAAAANDDWKARAAATKEAVHHAAETARQRAEAEKAAAEAERIAKAEEEQRYAAYYAGLEERNKAEAAKMAADELARQEEKARLAAEEEAAAAAETERMARAAEEAEARFQAVLNVIDGIGNALDMAANGVSTINSFAGGIFGSFEAASNMFDFNVLDKALDTMTSMVTQNVFGNMDRVLSRYDIINTFDDYMKLMGVAQDDADQAIARINESILGLPIGLDEAMYRLRRYQMFIGDLDTATNFTIGLQRSIIAGGASDSMKNMAYNQIERLLSAGELTNKRQWISLMTGLGVSAQFLAEQLGYEGWGGKELAAALYQNQISVDEFLGAIADIGAGGSAAAERLNQAIEIYKKTTESWRSNIEFAFIRGGEQTLESLDRVLLVNTDVQLVGYMKKFRDAVDSAFKEIRQWVEHNPQSVTLNIKAFDDLLGSVGKINAGNIASKGFGYIVNFVESISSALDNIGRDKIENFIAFGATIAGPIAAIANAAGPLGIAMGVIDRFADHDWSHFFGLISINVNTIADTVSRFLNIFSDNGMDHLLAFGMTYGPLIATGLSLMSKAMHGLSSALQTIIPLLTWFGLPVGLTAMAGLAGLGAWLVSYSSALSDAKLSEAWKEIENGIQKTQELHDTIDSILDVQDTAIKDADQKAKTLTDLLDKINALNSVVEDTGSQHAASELKTYVDLVNDLFPDVTLKIDDATGALDAHSKEILANRDAYIELITVMAQYDAASAALRSLYQSQIELNIDANKIEWDLEDLNARRAALEATAEGWGAWRWADPTFNAERNAILAQQKQRQRDREENARRRAFIQSQIPETIALVGQYSRAVDEIGSQTYKVIDETTQKVEHMATALFDAVDAGEKVGVQTKKISDLAKTQNKELENSESAFLEAAAAMDAAASSADKATDSSEHFSDSLEDVAEEAVEVEEKVTKAFTPLGLAVSSAFGAAAGEIEHVVSALQYFDDQINIIISSYTELRDATQESLGAMISGFGELGKIEPLNLANTIKGQTGNITTMEQLSAALDKVRDYLYENRGILDEYESSMWASFLANPAAHANEIVGLANAFGTADYGTLLSNMGIEDALTQSISQASAEAYSIVTQGLQNTMIAMKASGDESQWAEDYMHEFMMERGNAIKDAIKGVTLDGLLTDSGSEEDVTERLDEIREKFFGEDESLGGAVNELNDLLIELYSTTYADLEDGTDKLATVLDDFKQNHLQEIINAYDEASTKADELGKQATETGTEMSAQSETYSQFASVVSSIADAASNAANAIAGLASSLMGINGMSLNIPTVEVPASYAGANVAQPFATGGEVGGLYQGFDSVRALLTPGEFVVRRRAAQALGRNFLESLNNMNIPGAMDALMKQAIPMPGHFVAYNNSRSYDNHAQVNQYINTNNPAFTYRRASRFVGAL